MIGYIANAMLGGAIIAVGARLLNPGTIVRVNGQILSDNKKNMMGGIAIAAGTFVVVTTLRSR